MRSTTRGVDADSLCGAAATHRAQAFASLNPGRPLSVPGRPTVVLTVDVRSRVGPELKREAAAVSNEMRGLVWELMNDRPLQVKHRDHELSGDYSVVRECPIEPDW